MKKRILAVLLLAAMSVSLFTGCRNTADDTLLNKVTYTNYDPAEEVKDFEFGELSEEEKNYVVEMGLNNCDHMVAAFIGDYAGIYEAMGLKVNVTMSGETTKALISGAMDCGYIGVGASGLSKNPPYPGSISHHPRFHRKSSSGSAPYGGTQVLPPVPALHWFQGFHADDVL